MADQRPNTVLAVLLTEAGWSPQQLSKAVNDIFGVGTITRTAGYAWLRGNVPRAAIAPRIAAALTLRLGREVTAPQIWPELPGGESPRVEPASQGLDGPWDRAAAVEAILDLLAPGDLGRREFVAVSGAALLRAVGAWLDPHSTGPLGPPPATAPGSVLLEHVEASIPLLQRLDDAHGGAAHLPYVEAQLSAVALVLRQGGHPEQVTRGLLAACATIGQLCGWMALDAGQQAAAQRHWFRALRAARAVGDRPLAGHVLADLAFQAACGDAEHAQDGVVLGEAAADVVSRSPATVRASVSSRLALAYAASGRRGEFDAAAGLARDHLAARREGREPGWMYFLTESHLDCQAGYAHILMGRRQISLGDRAGRADLQTGVSLLRTGAHQRPEGDPSERRALYEGAWLALGHGWLTDYDESLRLAERATGRLSRVDSPRSTHILDTLVAHLRARTGNREIRERLPGIEASLNKARTR